MLKTILATTVTAFAASLASAQSADNYPSRPITVVVAAVPGGSVETEMRQYLLRMSKSMGQEFVILHKPGAGGAIGNDFVAKAKPDGYTLMAAEANLTTPPDAGQVLPYDPVKDFAPVSVISRRPAVLMVHPSVPVNTGKEYFEYARANPGKLNFGAVSATTRFNGEWMNKAAGVNIQIVDYKGTGQMMPDLLSGRIQSTAITFLSSMPHIRAGKMKALAITSQERSKLLPDLPTVAESGATGYAYVGWLGMLAPQGTPAAIVDKLNAELRKAAQDPALRSKLEEEFVEIMTSSPAQAATFIKDEIEAKRRAQALFKAGK